MAIIQKNLLELAEFTRGSAATGWVNGQLREFGIDEPRIVTDPVTGYSGLLLEPVTSTNYVTYSESNFAATTAAIVQYNYAMSPDGRNNATHIYGDSANSYARPQGAQTLNSGTSYCASVFCKPSSANSSRVAVWLPGSVFSEEGTGNGPQCRMDPDGSLATFGSPDAYGVEVLSDGWYRLWVSHKAVFTDSPSQLMRFWPIFARPDEADGWLFWGMQVEEGTRPTSYISTAGSQVTRAADNFILPIDRFDYRPDQGTLLVDGMLLGRDRGLWVAGLSSELSSGAGDRINLGWIDGQGRVSPITLISNEGDTASASLPISSRIPAGERFIIASSWGPDGFATASQSQISDPTVAPNGYPEANNLLLVTGDSMIINRISYYPERLPDAQLAALTEL